MTRYRLHHLLTIMHTCIQESNRHVVELQAEITTKDGQLQVGVLTMLLIIMHTCVQESDRHVVELQAEVQTLNGQNRQLQSEITTKDGQLQVSVVSTMHLDLAGTLEVCTQWTN